MSFGFSVGDFIAVIETAKRIRKEFSQAPSQFKSISNEVRSLTIILEDVEISVSDLQTEEGQQKRLQSILDGCKDVLSELEKTLTKYQELGREGSMGNRARKAWKRLQWEPAQISELRQQITSNVTLLRTFLDGLSSQTTLDIKIGVDQLNIQQNVRDRSRMLDWLSTLDFSIQQNDLMKRLQPETGTWLLDSQEYLLWVQGSNKTMFCPGIPGAGKTMLTAILVKDLVARFNDSDVGIAHIYCNYSQREEQQAEYLIASLLRQLSDKETSSKVLLDLYRIHHANKTRPSLLELSSALQVVATAYSQVFVVLDALDEIDIADVKNIVSKVKTLQSECGANIFATSRFIPEIQDLFKDCISLEIRASEDDLDRYLEGHLGRLPSFVQRSRALQQEIKTEIASAVDGMFLLAQIYIGSLEDKMTPRGIRQALKDFAQQNVGSGEDVKIQALALAYTHTMERINEQKSGFRNLAIRVLSWLTYAKRPLTVLELRHALAVERGETKLDEDNIPYTEDVVFVCAGLVTVDDESNIIRLVHYTTQEYFENTQQRWFPCAEDEIAMSCITYLCYETFQGFCESDEAFEERLRSNAFYSYAVTQWGHHAGNLTGLSGAAAQFLLNGAKVEMAVQGVSVLMFKWLSLPPFRDSQEFPRGANGLHLAAYFGIHGIVPDLVKAGIQVDTADLDSRTPLSWAAENGRETTIAAILQEGAAVNRVDANGRTPLMWAAASDSVLGVQVLLKNGAAVNSADENWATPILRAASVGSKPAVQMLLENGAAINIADNDGETPLQLAAHGGHEAVVSLLIDQGADMEASSFCGTALARAASQGHLGVVQLLLYRGAKVDTCDDESQTPLSSAAQWDRAETVQLLLDRNAEIDHRDASGKTPLASAAWWGSEDAMRVLLDNDAQIESRDVHDDTPLLLACKDLGIDAVRLLLSKGASVDACNRDGETALSLASESEELVKLLQEYGAKDHAEH